MAGTIEFPGGCGASTTRMILKRALETYGSIEVCHMGNRDDPEREPPWVRFSDPKAADAALEAINSGQVVINGNIMKAERTTRRGPPPQVREQNREQEIGSRELFLQRQRGGGGGGGGGDRGGGGSRRSRSRGGDRGGRDRRDRDSRRDRDRDRGRDRDRRRGRSDSRKRRSRSRS
eukprot:TRINITY_DN79736_c0_g1_i1.p1 TRINITY_DN79736_c0_g1~~TRINITY_DN79736_c0_g1_i1.p1  ORF type:complete len:176 (-),score=29.91 TRINITY_DN79736_c0_g1_i1:247-774(-)